MGEIILSIIKAYYTVKIIKWISYRKGIYTLIKETDQGTHI